jgi:hypothetical protein
MRFIWRKDLARAALCAVLCAAGAPRASASERQAATVNQVIAIVRAGLAKHEDKQTAKALSKLALGERLDAVVVEHLESEGAGLRTLEELAGFADATSQLPPPTPPPAFAHPPVPSREEMLAAIHHARVFASSYANNLPNFLCNEGVVRYEELRDGFGWEKRDTLGLKLGYEDGHESDKLVSFNGRATSRSLQSVGGAQTTGEFGGLMFQILDPKSNGKTASMRRIPTTSSSSAPHPAISRPFPQWKACCISMARPMISCAFPTARPISSPVSRCCRLPRFSIMRSRKSAGRDTRCL